VGALAIGAAALAIIVSALIAGLSAKADEKKDDVPPPPPPPPPKPVIVIDPVIDEPIHIDIDIHKGGGKEKRAVIVPVEQVGPDPLNPTPVPTPGQYYQVKAGDKGSSLCVQAYPGRPKPSMTWAKVAAHGLNAWLLGHLFQGIECGGFWPKWSGWKSTWASGHQYGLYYFPTLGELP
jgi:hypothetical protein